MPSEQSPARYRWRRVVAACGVITSFVALGAIGHDGQPGIVSLWLLCAGLALAGLSLHAIRKERRTGELLDRRRAERDQAESYRRAAEARSLELAETSPDIVVAHGPDGRMTSVSPACREVLGYEPEELVGRHGDDFVLAADLPVLLAMRNGAREADVDIARGLGKRTVAEMVGDQETLELLTRLGVDHAQGYHIGKPAPLAKWLVEERRKTEQAARKMVSCATS